MKPFLQSGNASSIVSELLGKLVDSRRERSSVEIGSLMIGNPVFGGSLGREVSLIGIKNEYKIICGKSLLQYH
jgi:hypothetical protein